MRAVFPVLGALVLLPAVAALAACGDPFGTVQDNLRTDSLTLAALNGPSTLPTAVDIVANSAPAQPELPGEAGAWDVQVRLDAGAFYLVPNPGSGRYRGAGLDPTTRTPESPGNAPRSSSSYTRTPVKVTPGDAFYVQSRQLNSICGTVPKYGLLKVISVAADSGVMHLVVRSNQGCDDERLQ